MDGSKALILCVNEGTLSTENLKNIPEESRFVGEVAQIRWSSQNKRYPGKVLMISGEYVEPRLVVYFLVLLLAFQLFQYLELQYFI